MPESAFSLDSPRYSKLDSLNSSCFFRQGVNLDSFIPEGDCLFLSILKNDLYIGIGILIGQNGKIAFRSVCFMKELLKMAFASVAPEWKS